jgi:hypothetical protein
MCAAKGASLGALKILLQRGADVSAIDGAGRTALAYAMTLDKVETLECARVLLAAGSKTKTPGPKCVFGRRKGVWEGRGAKQKKSSGDEWGNGCWVVFCSLRAAP